MKFADKLIALRKQNGWSQEELAEQMEVTRQSVSKWESAQSLPDLDKMIRLSSLFGVSIDYLVKDESENTTEFSVSEKKKPLRILSQKEALLFLETKKATAKSIALATFLCILSPICLFLLGAISEMPFSRLSENAALGLGMIVLLTMIAVAVVLFVTSGNKTDGYAHLEKELFVTDRELTEWVILQKEAHTPIYNKYNTLGALFCILSVIPLFIGILINGNNALLLVSMLSLLLILVGIGVFLFIYGGIMQESFHKLLQEEDYTPQKKMSRKSVGTLPAVYWPIAAAIYLAFSFITGRWDMTWILWIVFSALYPALVVLVQKGT